MGTRSHPSQLIEEGGRLVHEGRHELIGPINHQATNDQVSVSAVPPYAAIHQLGGVIETPARQGRIYRKTMKDVTIGAALSGKCSSKIETINKVATIPLLGQRTSTAALAWSLCLLAEFPVWQDKLGQEAARNLTPVTPA